MDALACIDDLVLITSNGFLFVFPTKKQNGFEHCFFLFSEKNICPKKPGFSLFFKEKQITEGFWMFSSINKKHVKGVSISHIKKKSKNLVTINLFDVISSYLWCCSHHWYDFLWCCNHHWKDLFTWICYWH